MCVLSEDFTHIKELDESERLQKSSFDFIVTTSKSDSECVRECKDECEMESDTTQHWLGNTADMRGEGASDQRD